MKVCGNCGIEYEESASRCPHCKSTFLKYQKSYSSAEDEYQKLKDELERKRKLRSAIIAFGLLCVVAAIVIGIVSIVNYANDPQRDIDKLSQQQYEQAVKLLEDGEYEKALNALDAIDPAWGNYQKAIAKRTEAIKGFLSQHVEDYMSKNDFAGLISFLNKYKEEINNDSELTTTYKNAVEKYVSQVLEEVDKNIASNDYDSANKALNAAIALVGENTTLANKVAEIEDASIMATISKYEKDSDFVSIVSYLQGIVEAKPSYQDLLNQYSGKLVQSTLEKAKAFADKRDFETAISEIEKVQAVYDCAEFQETVDRYYDLFPKNLVDCVIVDKPDFQELGIGTYEDRFGKTHENAIMMVSREKITSSYYPHYPYYVFNVEGKYALLSLSVVHGSGGYYEDAVAIRVYCDDKLVYTSPDIEKTTQEIHAEIDISNTQLVKIEACVIGDPTLPCGDVIVDARVS